MIAIKIYNLPFSVTFKKVNYFFKGFDVVPKSVVFGKNESGKNNGVGCILMKT